LLGTRTGCNDVGNTTGVGRVEVVLELAGRHAGGVGGNLDGGLVTHARGADALDVVINIGRTLERNIVARGHAGDVRVVRAVIVNALRLFAQGGHGGSGGDGARGSIGSGSGSGISTGDEEDGSVSVLHFGFMVIWLGEGFVVSCF